MVSDVAAGYLDRIYGIGFWIAAKRKSWRKKEGGFLGRKISAGFLDRINGIGFWIAAKGKKLAVKGVGGFWVGKSLPDFLDRINGIYGIGFWIAAKGKVGEKGVGELLLVT